MRPLLYLAFVLSGAAGLMYESIWSRYLGLFVGHSAYAQIIVLTIFLGGMSLGAALVGRHSERIREPLFWYASVEMVVGMIGLAFHAVYGAVTTVAYDTVFPALAGSPLLTVTKWGLVALLILPQSVLLGATFPLMSAGLLRRAPQLPGRTLSLLYFTNSFGAAAGVLVAGFYLVAAAGLPGTLTAAAILNLIVGLLTIVALRVMRALPADGPSAATAPASPAPAAVGGIEPGRLRALLLAVTFGTAVASFVYEISWIRMLAMVLGSATHAFELMLSAFILGLALGALWAGRRADRFQDPVRALGIVQWCMGLAALATLPVYLSSYEWTAYLLHGLRDTDQGYMLFGAARYAFALAVMLPATFFAGVTLPLITRTLLAAGHGERAIGTVYAVNTVGSILGVVLAGLVLLPVVGLKALLVAGATLDMVLGVLLILAAAKGRPSGHPLALVTAAGVLVAVALATVTNRFDPQLLASGVYRHGLLPVTSGPGAKEVLFYRHGRTASVSVTRTGEKEDTHIAISTNGKPDGSISPTRYASSGGALKRTEMGGDESTQLLLPLISLAHAPRAASVAVIGHGTGMSSHVLLGSSHVRELYTIEIEPEMIAGSRAFYPANRRAFDDPRSHQIVDDAKSFFAASGKRFDFILSEPSNPWVSGVSGLFTAEFYQRVRRQLAPGGVFAQWLHLYEINDGLVLTVLAALHQSFPDYQIYMTGGLDIIIVASADSAVPVPEWGVFEYPGIAADLRRVLPFTPRVLEASWLVDRRTLAPLLDSWGQPNSDYYPVLDLGGERARFTSSGATGFTGLTAEPFDIVAALSGRRSPFTDEIDVPVPGITRMAALARGAMLRAAVDSAVVEPTLRARYNEAAQRGWRFRAMLADSAPPADWTLWLADAQASFIDVHGGTAGVVDERFFADLRRYTDRHHAPNYVRDVIAFLHGLAAWDFQEAAAATDRLAPAMLGGAQFLGTGLFSDGAVVAKLKTNNPADARRILVGMDRRTGRRPGNLRTRLLAAYVVAAGARQTPLAAETLAPHGASAHSGGPAAGGN
jgi:hypothetical protein